MQTDHEGLRFTCLHGEPFEGRASLAFMVNQGRGSLVFMANQRFTYLHGLPEHPLTFTTCKQIFD